jgi:hypothetical protein
MGGIMKYRVTWTVEVDADSDEAARNTARRYLLDHEDEALAKVAEIEEGSSPREVPHVRAGEVR